MNDLPAFLHALNARTVARRRARRLGTFIDHMVFGSAAALTLSMAIQLILAHQAGRL